MLYFNFIKGHELGLFGSYTKAQEASINALLDACNRHNVTLANQIAYVLATAYHECHNPAKPDLRMTPMKEFGGERYLRSKPYWPYFGRGFVQLTWRQNYAKQSQRLGIDLVKNPDLVLGVETAADIAVHGMKFGTFTGKKLSDYITANKTDFPNARRIINGTDKMALIASYAHKFAQCLYPKN